MAEFSTPEERTEYPTDRRMGQLRREGSIFHSVDLEQVLSLTAGFLIVSYLWSWLFTDFQYVLIRAFSAIGSSELLTTADLYGGFLFLLYLLGPEILIIVTVVAVVSTLSVMLQTDWNVKEKKINWKWDLIHPIGGLQRIVSLQGIVNTLKALFKLGLILPIGYFGLQAFAPQMVMLLHSGVPEILTFTGAAVSTLFWKITYVLMAMAIFDYFWGKHQWLKIYKMTKDEVKDERKAIEGDETTRRKIQQKGLLRILQRIRQSIPLADVVVTNPTHYAVALKYDREKMNAPIVLAKGKGFLAQRIKELARKAGVPVLERKALARALFESAEVGVEIPHQLFKAVAEVLAYVYRLRNPYRRQQQGAK